MLFFRPIAVSFIGLSALTAIPAFAQGPQDTEQLLKIIAQQQEQLEAQQARIDAQRRTLRELRNAVEALRTTQTDAAIAETTVDRPARKQQGRTGGVQLATARAAPAHAIEAHTQVLSPSVSAAPTQPQTIATDPADDWPGSFNLPGTSTQIKLSGFVELDAIHDANAIETPSAFVTSAIVTRNQPAAEGSEGQTTFSVQPTRLAIETRTPLAGHRLTTFASADWFGDFMSGSPDLRLREAYGEVDRILFGGDLLIGQTWSTVTDLLSAPNVLDFQGPNALFGNRRPLVRWTRTLRPEWTLKLAAEAPDLRILDGASSVSRWPDAVIALNWQTHRADLTGSLIARDLRASTDQGAKETTGWGASVQGRLHMPAAIEQDFMTFSLTYGEGIGGLINDGPPDAVYDLVNNRLEPIPTLAWYAAYQHWWNPRLYSVLSYGQVSQETLMVQMPTAYKNTQYATANLTWTPFPQWLLGVELMVGTREDKDGAQGSDTRTQLTSRYLFP